jgi:hypothetical protein
MGRVVVINHVTFDGVMQAPGRPDEDRRGGFEHGGWAVGSGRDSATTRSRRRYGWSAPSRPPPAW